jgi:dTDP-4-dehydrorhamnose reductase
VVALGLGGITEGDGSALFAAARVKVLLLGGHGLLGTAFRSTAPSGVEVAAPRRIQVDVTDHAALARAVDAAEPEWIINCAAMTAVDAAEGATEEAMRINADAAATIAALAHTRGTRVLLPSTDYVFDGPRDVPWGEADAPTPRSVYAKSKRAGEERLLASGAEALIVRTGWLFGDGGKNFPATMWQRASARTPSRVVNDQVGTPTSTRDAAAWSWALVAREARGIFHATNAGRASWFDVAQRIYDRCGFPDGITGVSTEEYGARAPRPAFSVLDCSRLERTLGATRRSWEQALDEYLATLVSSTT